MTNKIQISQLGSGLYIFNVDNFSSYTHHILCHDIKSVYKYAHDAYKDAHKVAKQYHYYVDSLNKTARDEWNDVMVSDASADDMIYNQYDRMLKQYRLKAKGVKGYEKGDKDEKEKAKLLYEEIKAIVGEILRVTNEIEDKKQKTELESLIKEYGSVVKRYLNSLLLEDVRKIEKEKTEGAENPLPTDAPLLDQPDQLNLEAPQGVENSLAFNINKIIKLANEVPHFTKKEINEILEHYRDLICDRFKIKDSSVIGLVNLATKEIAFKNTDGEFLVVTVGNNLLVKNVIPLGKVAKIYPVSSSMFYQKYWKPVVEAVKHFFIQHNGDDYAILLKNSLPDIPKTLPASKPIKIFNLSNQSEVTVNIKFHDKNSVWTIDLDTPIDKNVSENNAKTYIETKYVQGGKGAIVVCVDAELESIYKKTGVVVQIIPFENNLELDIDFGHHVVRLTEDQIEIVDI